MNKFKQVSSEGNEMSLVLEVPCPEGGLCTVKSQYSKVPCPEGRRAGSWPGEFLVQ